MARASYSTTPLLRSLVHRPQGVILVVDPELSWNAHISNVVRKCYAILFSLYKCRYCFTPDVLKVIIQVHVFSHIRYCICVWGGASKSQLQKLQKVINFAARIVTGLKKYDHVTPALSSLGSRT